MLARREQVPLKGGDRKGVNSVCYPLKTFFMHKGEVNVFRKKIEEESWEQSEIHKYKQSEILQVEEKDQK